MEEEGNIEIEENKNIGMERDENIGKELEMMRAQLFHLFTTFGQFLDDSLQIINSHSTEYVQFNDGNEKVKQPEHEFSYEFQYESKATGQIDQAKELFNYLQLHLDDVMQSVCEYDRLNDSFSIDEEKIERWDEVIQQAENFLNELEQNLDNNKDQVNDSTPAKEKIISNECSDEQADNVPEINCKFVSVFMHCFRIGNTWH